MITHTWTSGWADGRGTGVQSARANEGIAKAAQSTDADWVRAAVAGDAAAFEHLYRRHVDRIFGLCLRLVDGDRSKAEHYTQDVFVRAWEKLGSFRGEAQFSTWLHRLAVNLVLGEYRLLRRWVSFDDHMADQAGDEPRHDPHRTTGERLDVERALARLPKGARAVIMLHDVEGYRHEEIAALTGIAVGTSKAQLHRARKLMKEWLA